jgi:Ni,Fe-hydrogenase I small subunit
MSVHMGCNRADWYEQADFTYEYGSPKCLVKIGCWGPAVQCNVPKRGWISGMGGCPNVGGICIGCTMPGFPDKVHAVYGRAAWGRPLIGLDQTLWGPDSAIASAHQQHSP